MIIIRLLSGNSLYASAQRMRTTLMQNTNKRKFGWLYIYRTQGGLEKSLFAIRVAFG